MNNLDNPNLKETIISTIQELKAQNPNFFTENCHLLTWKSKTIEGALITKVNGQRYLGFQRKDIKGQDYWKYKPLTSEKLGGESSAIQPSSSTNPSPPAKNETPVQSVEESEQVKKFREKFPNEFSAKQKYGTPNSTPAEQ